MSSHFSGDRNSPTPGLSFDLSVNHKKIETNEGWRVTEHPAFYLPKGDVPNYRLPESNIGFDAGSDILFYMPDYDYSAWPKAKSNSSEEAGWNKFVARPIPQWKDFGLKEYDKIERRNDTVIAYLPYNAQITPYLKVRAPKGEKIDIRTDNYRGGGALNVFAEYLTAEGEQEFECLGWMNGHQVYYTIPSSVEVLELKFRESGYDTDFKIGRAHV